MNKHQDCDPRPPLPLTIPNLLCTKKFELLLHVGVKKTIKIEAIRPFPPGGQVRYFILVAYVADSPHVSYRYDFRVDGSKQESWVDDRSFVEVGGAIVPGDASAHRWLFTLGLASVDIWRDELHNTGYSVRVAFAMFKRRRNIDVVFPNVAEHWLVSARGEIARKGQYR